MLNNQLGDDSSPTDRLVIDGGSASGDTGLRVINAGGEGAYTTHGIRLVQTINGATTAADAFHLDAGSTGYRASADTLARMATTTAWCAAATTAWRTTGI